MWRISIFLSTCMSHPTVASFRSRAGGTPLQEALPQEGQEALLNERGEGPPQREPLSGSPARPESLLYLPREAQPTQAVLTPGQPLPPTPMQLHAGDTYAPRALLAAFGPLTRAPPSFPPSAPYQVGHCLGLLPLGPVFSY